MKQKYNMHTKSAIVNNFREKLDTNHGRAVL